MITDVLLSGVSLLQNKVHLQSFENASFPATVYTRSKRGGYQGNKLPTPSFSSYTFVATFQIAADSFDELITTRHWLLGLFGQIHSAGSQTLTILRSDATSVQIDIKAIQVTGNMSVDDGLSSLVQVTLEAEYPFLQNTNPMTQDVLTYNAGGMSVPMEVPLDLSHGHSMLVTLVNNGNYPAFPNFNFVGVLTNPSIQNVTTGETLFLSQTLSDSSHSALIDCYNRTVILNPSGNNGRQYVSGKFWTVPVGSSIVTLNSTNITDVGKCTITFRDTYLNI